MALFEGVGRIYKLRLMMNFSGSNRGFCFAQFFTLAEARAAIESFHGFEIRHRKRFRKFRNLLQYSQLWLKKKMIPTN